MAQQTAVEYLLSNLPNRFRNAILNECGEEIEKAKEMEKEQIINAFDNGIIAYNNQDRITDDIDNDSEQYYNQTYNK